MKNTANRFLKTTDMAYISLFSVLIVICSWLCIPSAVPFTLQTFGIFCALIMLGGKRGTISVLIYILLGAAGMPVFSGFIGGIGVILGPTGGYIIGFLILALAYWFITKLFGSKKPTMILAMLTGLVCCYCFGTFWFVCIYSNMNITDIMHALNVCVLPFIIPDIIKLALAFFVSASITARMNTALK